MSDRSTDPATAWMLSVGIHVVAFLGMGLIAMDQLIPSASNGSSIQIGFRDQAVLLKPAREDSEVWERPQRPCNEPFRGLEESDLVRERPRDSFEVEYRPPGWWLSTSDSPPRKCRRDGHRHCGLGFCQPFRGPWPELGFGNFTTTRRISIPDRAKLLIGPPHD